MERRPRLSYQSSDRRTTHAFARSLLQRSIPFAVTAKGAISYSAAAEEIADEIINGLRSRIYPEWQVLTCPPEWADLYAAYMEERDIPFVTEWIDRKLAYLLPAAHQPHDWPIATPARRRAGVVK